ncbi:MAG: MmcQ/YjbR family DNA-binding protein [Proteobacteria bacterium]|nr:MmcQ/YjbR family DNA-binding protein [Pseudomonadota bacterium]
MELETVIAYLSGKKGAEQDFPFGPEVLVFKVLGKMFALMGLEETPLRVNLKCDPHQAEILRDLYPSVLPGYHMNKKHWNTVILDNSLPEEEVLAMMDDSYDLVVAGLSRADRERLAKGESG